MNSYEQNVMKNIEKFGCSVTHVMADEDGPGFTYSIGIQQQTAKPEVIVVGLPPKLMHFMVNEYNKRVKAGQEFAENELYDGFIEGFQVMFKAIDLKHYDDYMGSCQWLYNGDDFQAFQIVWPSTAGKWPWEKDASEQYLDSMTTLY